MFHSLNILSCPQLTAHKHTMFKVCVFSTSFSTNGFTFAGGSSLTFTFVCFRSAHNCDHTRHQTHTNTLPHHLFIKNLILLKITPSIATLNMHLIIDMAWSWWGRSSWVCLGSVSLSLLALCSRKIMKMVVRLHKHGVSVGLKAPTVGDFKRVIFISDWGNFPLRLSEKNERKAEKEKKKHLCKCKSVISGEVRWCPMPARCWRISLSLSSACTHTHTRAHTHTVSTVVHRRWSSVEFEHKYLCESLWLASAVSCQSRSRQTSDKVTRNAPKSQNRVKKKNKKTKTPYTASAAPKRIAK